MGDTIIGVQFGIANPEDIVKRSVVEVTTDKTYQGSQPIPNGVFDARFGVIENGKVCPTCKQTNQFCPGHFGHIRLARPVYLYQFFDMIEKLANVICLNCSKPLASPDELTNLKSSGLGRFKEVRDLRPNPRPKEPYECRHCQTPIFKKVAKVLGKAATLEGHVYNTDPDTVVDPVTLQPEMILRAFQRMTDEDCRFIGLNPEFARPCLRR
jgi:DNA-directed RNA polymerase beta' subunit